MRTRFDLGYYAGMKLTQKQTKTTKNSKKKNGRKREMLSRIKN